MGDGIGDFAFWLAVGCGSLGFLFGPIGRAVGRWIESIAARKEGASTELELRLDEVAHLSQRMGELEERLDFTERLLAQQRSKQLDEIDTPPEALPVAR